MIDHRSYTHNLSIGEVEAWKRNQAWTRVSNPGLLRYRCSALPSFYQLSYKANWELAKLQIRICTLRWWRMIVNKWSNMHLNCSEWYNMTGHSSNAHDNLGSCETLYESHRWRVAQFHLFPCIMRTSKNVCLETLCACSERKTRTRSRPRPPI